jgi:LmbE family N-acetylglucosaminyl deacetylase
MAETPAVPDLTGRGTPESTWSTCSALAALPSWQPRPPAAGRIVVIAPHPDDEILGAGGTIARLCRAGSRVELVAVTDGEQSHPDMEDHLRAIRPLETLAAAARLGIELGAVSRLRHPDGQIDEARLAEQLVALIRPGDLVLAQWQRDGHPDHDAAGRAAATAAARRGADLLAYLVWAWHWAKPGDLPWERAVRIDIAHVAGAKRAAAACFRSQVSIDPVVLPPHVRRRLLRSYEVLVRP